MKNGKPVDGQKRRLYSIAITTCTQAIYLRGWGESQGDCIKNLKEENIKNCIEMAMGFEDQNKTPFDVAESFINHMRSERLDSMRWHYDYYDQVYDAKRREWLDIGQVGHWSPKYPVRLGL